MVARIPLAANSGHRLRPKGMNSLPGYFWGEALCPKYCNTQQLDGPSTLPPLLRRKPVGRPTQNGDGRPPSPMPSPSSAATHPRERETVRSHIKIKKGRGNTSVHQTKQKKKNTKEYGNTPTAVPYNTKKHKNKRVDRKVAKNTHAAPWEGSKVDSAACPIYCSPRFLYSSPPPSSRHRFGYRPCPAGRPATAS